MRASSVLALLGVVGPLAAAKQCSYGDDPSIIAHSGTPVGREIRQSANVTLYVSEPACKKPKIGVLYLSDAFGIQFTQNKL